MVVGGDYYDAFPSPSLDEPCNFDRFFPRIFRSVLYPHNCFRGHAKRFQIVFHQIRYAGVLSQHPSAGHDHGGDPFTVQIRRMESAISQVIVVAKNNQGIAWRDRLIHHPKLTGGAQQRMPDSVNGHEKSKEKQKEKQAEENSALCAAPHAKGSSLRSRSAAASGMMGL